MSTLPLCACTCGGQVLSATATYLSGHNLPGHKPGRVARLNTYSETIVQLYGREHMAIATVASLYACDPKHIKRILRTCGVPLRTRVAQNQCDRHKRLTHGVGGKIRDGYRFVAIPTDHWLFPMASRIKQDMGEHRYVMAMSLGRLLKPEERVHHINGDRLDNRIANLQLLHVGGHPSGQAGRCLDCGSQNLTFTEVANAAM